LVLAGWTIQKSGTTGITVQNYIRYPPGGPVASPIQQVGASASGVAKDPQIGVSATSGVQRGQTTDGTKWTFSFLTNPIDGTTTLQDNAVVQATIDGVTITDSVFAGETATQVTSDFYNAMVSAGITDAVLSRAGITFLNNTSGQEALSVSLTITGPSGGSPVSWLETDVTIAQRNILGLGGLFLRAISRIEAEKGERGRFLPGRYPCNWE
jgi:hypothetical protein